jgi:hypothetical protein
VLKERDVKEEPAETAAPWRKEYGLLIQKAAATVPTEDDLALINALALRPMQAEDVLIVPMRLANTQVDRSFEQFPKAYLDRFAETLPGKSLMQGHDYRSAPAGRFFDAEVRRDAQNGGHYLYARAFMRATNPLADDVAAGVAKGVSIGFQPDTRTCDLCGKDYDGYWKSRSQRAQADDEPCSHIAGREYDGKVCTLTYSGDTAKVEALEGSLVWLGCQRGAETSPKAVLDAVSKAAHFDALASAGGKGETMDPKELVAAQARVKELEGEVARLTPLAEDGTKYREWLQSEVKRLYASMDDEATGELLAEAHADATAAKLETIRAAAAERQKAVLDPRGGAVSGQGASDLPKRSVDDILFGPGMRGGVR